MHATTIVIGRTEKVNLGVVFQLVKVTPISLEQGTNFEKPTGVIHLNIESTQVKC